MSEHNFMIFHADIVIVHGRVQNIASKLDQIMTLTVSRFQWQIEKWQPLALEAPNNGHDVAWHDPCKQLEARRNANCPVKNGFSRQSDSQWIQHDTTLNSTKQHPRCNYQQHCHRWLRHQLFVQGCPTLHAKKDFTLRTEPMKNIEESAVKDFLWSLD